MGYNFSLLAYTEISLEEVTKFKDLISQEHEIDDYIKYCYGECYSISSYRIGGYMFTTLDTGKKKWHIGVSFSNNKENCPTTPYFLVKEMNEAIAELSQILGRTIDPDNVEIKFSSEGHPLIVKC